MTTRRVGATWAGGWQVDLAAGRFALRVDEPESAGGGDTGPQPTDLFLASVASCFVLALVYSARRQGVRLAAVEVSVTGTYDGPRFSDIAIDVRSPLPPDSADALLAGAEQVCYVTNTLREPPRLVVHHPARSRP
jgi:uncharacterized OsmC-like protein